MSRTMYDSVTVSDLPKHATMVAGYVDGAYANLTALRKRFPKATVVTITVAGANTADVIDCETGDATPSQAAAWAKRMIHAGRVPTIYCNRSTWPAVKSMVTKAGIAGKVHYWIADWSGHPHLLPGSVATQYADPLTSGGHYDVSLVADHWPGVDHAHHKPTPHRPSGWGRWLRSMRFWQRRHK